MPFYFHQRVGEDFIEDPEGFDFSSLAAVRTSAMVSARHLWAAAIVAGEDLCGESIEIADEYGRHLLSVPLSDALPFRLACAAAQSVGPGPAATPAPSDILAG